MRLAHELIRNTLRERHVPREVSADPHASYYGTELNERSLVPTVDARFHSSCALSGANLGDLLPVEQNGLYPLWGLSDDRLAQVARERLQVIIWEGTSPGERCRQDRWECTGTHLTGQQGSEELCHRQGGFRDDRGDVLALDGDMRHDTTASVVNSADQGIGRQLGLGLAHALRVTANPGHSTPSVVIRAVMRPSHAPAFTLLPSSDA